MDRTRKLKKSRSPGYKKFCVGHQDGYGYLIRRQPVGYKQIDTLLEARKNAPGMPGSDFWQPAQKDFFRLFEQNA